MSITSGSAVMRWALLIACVSGSPAHSAKLHKAPPPPSQPTYTVEDLARALLPHNTARHVDCSEPAIMNAVIAKLGDANGIAIQRNPSYAYVEALSRKHPKLDFRDILADQPQCLAWSGDGPAQPLYGVRVLDIHGLEVVEVGALP